ASAPSGRGGVARESTQARRGRNMKNVANARFTIKSWDEKPYSEGEDLPKLTRAAVTKTFIGDIAGNGHVEYLMMYRNDGSATFVRSRARGAPRPDHPAA